MAWRKLVSGGGRMNEDDKEMIIISVAAQIHGIRRDPGKCPKTGLTT